MGFKTCKLCSLKPEEYPDMEVECIEIEDLSTYMLAWMNYQSKNGVKLGTAVKNARVNARVGVVGEKVDTRPRVERDGKIYCMGESKDVVKVEGSMIVTNPDGEQYIVKPGTFESRYKPTEIDGVYEPISTPIRYIEIEDDIVFKAPWGEDMFALCGAAINVTNFDDMYAIQNVPFSATYQITNNGRKVEADREM